MSHLTPKEELKHFLLRQIAIPSAKADATPGAPFGAETVHALEDFLAQAEKDGFRTRRLDGYAGYLEWGPEDENLPIVAAVCHLDVVPAGDWADAYTPKVEGDRIIGRGSSDDKGPAIACYYALLDLKRQGYEPQCRLRLILGLDEESGSACMAHYNKVAEAPVAAFTADAEFPVIHAEKGLLQCRLHYDAKKDPHAASQEASADLKLLGATAGTRANVIPGRAYLTWEKAGEKQEEEILGQQGHASTPELGKNAIALAMKQAAERLAQAGGSHPFVTFFQACFDQAYDGQHLGIACCDEVSGALTQNVAILNLDGDLADLTLDMRIPVTVSIEEIEAKIQDALKAYGVTYERLSYSAPLYLPKDHPLVSTLTQVFSKVTGKNLEPIAIGGGTYARSLPNTVAFGPFMPGEEGLAHQTGEYVDLEDLMVAREVFVEAFKALDQTYAK